MGLDPGSPQEMKPCVEKLKELGLANSKAASLLNDPRGQDVSLWGWSAEVNRLSVEIRCKNDSPERGRLWALSMWSTEARNTLEKALHSCL
jgi:hypothetical protein